MSGLGELVRRAGRRLRPMDVVRRILRETLHNRAQLEELRGRVHLLQEALGRIEARQVADQADLAGQEFRVFSQWGEDGLVEALVRRLDGLAPRFVEIGVESYEQANTRFLLVNRNWSGLLLERDPEHVAQVRRSPLHWLHDLTVAEAHVTAENLDGLLQRHGFTGELGLLSIDVDGVDYWLWKALEVATPTIVVVEYNFRFGPDLAVTVPYDPDFDRRRAHPSLLYFGASLRALARLADAKGYALVAVGSHGLNAFFVRRERLGADLRELDVAEAFRAGRFGEAHTDDGRRVRWTPAEEARLVQALPLVHVDGARAEEPRP